MMPKPIRALLVVLACLAPALVRAGEDAQPVTVLAASSLSDVLPRVGNAWTTAGHAPVRFSFDASSRLAKQIESGLGADVFVSADLDWMDYLEQRKLVVAGTRAVLLGNRLVIAIPSTSSLTFPDARPLTSTGVKHLALAAETVPVGKYARAALAWARIAKDVEGKIVSGDNVRTVLGWVASGEADAGLVYATDARAEPRVKVAYTFPVSAHPPIVYPAAVLAGAADAAAAREFLAFCRGAEARTAFEAAGFTWLAEVH
jgi:molybdate transport system substrate-binding protein